jgi:hypothetical protein
MEYDPPTRCFRSRTGIVAIGAFLIALTPFRLQAQGDTVRVTVTGTVLDDVTKRPLEGAEIRLRELDLTTRSDAEGRFVLADLGIGTYELSVQREGYRSKTGPFRVVSSGSFRVALIPEGAPLGDETSRVSGRVTDQATGEPVEGVEVGIEGTEMALLTDGAGRFAFPEIDPGDYTLSFSMLGYATRREPVAVGRAQVLSLDVILGIEPVQLDPVSVTVERRNLSLDLAGFYARREVSAGIFLSRDQIEERRAIQTTDLFNGLPGVRVLGSGFERSVVLRGGLQMTLSQGICAPAVFLDGILMEGAAQAGGLDRIVQPSEIQGMEIYTGITRVPLQYSTPGSRCGVIVLWTR